jgi:hypothetical protein
MYRYVMNLKRKRLRIEYICRNHSMVYMVGVNSNKRKRLRFGYICQNHNTVYMMGVNSNIGRLIQENSAKCARLIKQDMVLYKRKYVWRRLWIIVVQSLIIEKYFMR